MIRRAIIIECSAIAGQDRLPGASADAQSWRNYLYSGRGGDWYDSEIEILHNPTPATVRSRIKQIAVDYAFVAFSGHGYVDKKTGDTMACLDGGELSDVDLTPSCDRVTLIMDSCRGVLQEQVLAKANAEFREANAEVVSNRKLFDEAVIAAEKGTCRIYGCAFGQAAQETRAGGAFTHALIQAGLAWTGRGGLSLRDAFDAADTAVRRRDPQQTPEAQLGRRLRHFPFAVKPSN